MSNDAEPDDRIAIAWSEHRRRLLDIAYRMLGSRADAEDMVQEAYLRWHHSDAERVLTPEAWLVTIAHRKAIDHHRAHGHRQDPVEDGFEVAIATDRGDRGGERSAGIAGLSVGTGRAAYRTPLGQAVVVGALLMVIAGGSASWRGSRAAICSSPSPPVTRRRMSRSTAGTRRSTRSRPSRDRSRRSRGRTSPAAVQAARAGREASAPIRCGGTARSTRCRRTEATIGPIVASSLRAGRHTETVAPSAAFASRSASSAGSDDAIGHRLRPHRATATGAFARFQPSPRW